MEVVFSLLTVFNSNSLLVLVISNLFSTRKKTFYDIGKTNGVFPLGGVTLTPNAITTAAALLHFSDRKK